MTKVLATALRKPHLLTNSSNVFYGVVVHLFHDLTIGVYLEDWRNPPHPLHAFFCFSFQIEYIHYPQKHLTVHVSNED